MKKYHDADEAWLSFVEWFPDEFVVIVFGTTVFGAFVYWFIGVQMTLAELCMDRQRKLQPQTDLSPTQYRTAIRQVLVNQLLINPLLLAGYAWLMPKLNWHLTDRLPTLPTVLLQTVIFIAVEELLLYTLHRAMHVYRWAYTHFHAPHHAYTAPTPLTALATHPVDHVLLNAVPALVGPMVVRAHLVVVWMWLGVAQVSALEAHTGYDLSPFFGPPYRHDLHHSHGHVFYGAIGLLDKLFGTDKVQEGTDREVGKSVVAEKQEDVVPLKHAMV